MLFRSTMHHLGHIPRSGEYFESDGLRFEILDMDGNRVDKVLVIRMAEKAERRVS